MTTTAGDWTFAEVIGRAYVLSRHHGRAPAVAEVSMKRRHYVANGLLLAAAPKLLSIIKKFITATDAITKNWEHGDLAVTIRNLAALRDKAQKEIETL
ncbi:MAG: hypothetical protein ACRD2A_19415 [Vicinamibacterales bacterium]